MLVEFTVTDSISADETGSAASTLSWLLTLLRVKLLNVGASQ